MSRDDQTDSRGKADVGFEMDFSVGTLADEIESGGSTRVNRPVGAPPPRDLLPVPGNAESG